MNDVKRVRIGTLKLRLPASSAESPKALAADVASRLALQASSPGVLTEQESIQAKVIAPASGSRSTLAASIVAAITKRRGR